MSGEYVADVESVELAHAEEVANAEYSAFKSQRVLIYRARNGTKLSFSGKRPVQPLVYKHSVQMGIGDGSRLRLRAIDADGRERASAWADGAGSRRVGLWGHAYELIVRVPLSAPKPDTKRRRSKSVATGSCEEYWLRDLGPVGMCSALWYRRTGRCPTWYGPGTCTLELHARRHWSLAFWKQGPPACWRRCEAEVSTTPAPTRARRADRTKAH